jgi:hypothetical protein
MILTQPFLPFLLQAWLARSGRLPLALRIVSSPYLQDNQLGPLYQILTYSSNADFQLLKIFLSESWRWETVAVIGHMYDWKVWNHNFDKPQLRIIECTIHNLSRFSAPNPCLLRTRLLVYIEFKLSPLTCPVPNFKIYAIFTSLPPITYVIFFGDVLSPESYGGRQNRTHSPHESIPIKNSSIEPVTFTAHPDCWNGVLRVFDGLDLPKLRKLTLVGNIGQATVYGFMAALEDVFRNIHAADPQILGILSSEVNRTWSSHRSRL